MNGALGYAHRGCAVFPCHWRGERRKRPLIECGLHAATQDNATIRDWWHRWPDALIGVPVGRRSGFVVLDVDVKGAAYGFDTLADLGFGILPNTPMVHTASGRLHMYFRAPDHLEIRNTAGERGSGIGPSLDWRGEGGYVIVPSLGSGYEWDPVCGPDTVLARVPSELLPHAPERTLASRSKRPTAFPLTPELRSTAPAATSSPLQTAYKKLPSTASASRSAVSPAPARFPKTSR